MRLTESAISPHHAGTQDAAEPEALFDVVNGVGIATLNRPRQLNALSYPMIVALGAQLEAWAQDDAIRAVVLRGAGRKAFCAGGDIRALYDSYRDGTPLHRRFFIDEYTLDYRLHRYPKPLVALMDGVVMGGGMGLAQAAHLRIVTERSRVAKVMRPIEVVGEFLRKHPCGIPDLEVRGLTALVPRKGRLDVLLEAGDGALACSGLRRDRASTRRLRASADGRRAGAGGVRAGCADGDGRAEGLRSAGLRRRRVRHASARPRRGLAALGRDRDGVLLPAHGHRRDHPDGSGEDGVPPRRRRESRACAPGGRSRRSAAGRRGLPTRLRGV